MIEAHAWGRAPSPKTHSDVTRKAFQSLKWFDRDVAKSDPLLIQIETAYRQGDTESLLWMTALALSHMLGEATNG